MSDSKASIDAPSRPSVTDASTILLVRQGEPYEVFLVQRARRSAFMGGMYVFPGGKLDPEDSLQPVLDRAGADAMARCVEVLDPTPGRPLDAPVAVGLYVAACREVFEEAGVLLAKRAGEDHCISFDAPDVDARFTAYRQQLRDGDIGFAGILEAEDLTLDFEGLTYLAHWITPSRENRRYDTRFFVARQPIGQTPLIDAHETTAGAWMSPADALTAYVDEKIELSPPTMRNLEDIAGAAGVDGLLDMARSRSIAPILPKLIIVGEQIAIVLPWDAAYADAEGESLDLGPGAHPMQAGPSRLVLEGQRWMSR